MQRLGAKIMQAGVEIRSEIYYITWKENRDAIIVVVNNRLVGGWCQTINLC